MMIGQQMQQAMQDSAKNPVGKLRMIVAGMANDLRWYEKKYPGTDVSKRWKLIQDLDEICRTMEGYGALDVWSVIWKKLGEAKDQGYDADTALVYCPLKPILPAYHESRQIVVDLCGYNLTPYEYDYCRGKFFTSWINDKEGEA